jgi:enoyl-CoA hydratase/carnithine racemase
MSMLEISESLVRDGSPDSGSIRVIKLARPPVNALNGELVRTLIAVVGAAKSDSAIVITGQPGIFSGGLDVPGMLMLDREAIATLFVDLWRLQRAIATSPVPVVFGLTGHCPAGGTVLAIHGDYRVMARGEFRMGLNEVQVGLYPGGVIHGAFKRLVGGHAAQLLTRGALIDPATALRVGLVDELCDAEQVPARALEVAREICALPREPMLRTRALVRRDLVDLFGNPGHALVQEREFGAMGVEMWFVPATQERLKALFVKKR